MLELKVSVTCLLFSRFSALVFVVFISSFRGFCVLMSVASAVTLGPNRTYIDHIEKVVMPILEGMSLEALIHEKSENENAQLTGVDEPDSFKMEVVGIWATS